MWPTFLIENQVVLSSTITKRKIILSLLFKVRLYLPLDFHSLAMVHQQVIVVELLVVFRNVLYKRVVVFKVVPVVVLLLMFLMVV